VPDVDALEAKDSPFALLAFTVNVYAVPLVKPVTLHDVAGALTVQVKFPGLDVTV
jgi:hypothetical protein